MPNPEKTFTSKLGTTRAGERTRIWLEGNRLLAHGFTHGAHFQRLWLREGKLVLAIVGADTFESLERDLRGTVAGSAARPIIDIATTRVAETFKGDRVNVTYRPGRITITEQE
jgi:hypothetical protein